jgi:hypothetical protein
MTLDEASVPVTTNRSNVMTLAAFGTLSGATAWALIHLIDVVGSWFGWSEFELVDLFLDALQLFPGLVFGLVIGALLHRRGKVEGLRQVGYVAASGLAYFCAVLVASHVKNTLFSPSILRLHVVDLAISGIPGGLVGCLLLGLMTMLLLRAPGRLVLRWPVLVGGAAGALLGLLALEHDDWDLGLLAFFVLWQGAYAASLAPLLRPAAISQQGLSH